MPHATTVINRVNTRANTFREKLVPRVKQAIADKRCQASTDMWTDDQRKSHFIAITVSFLEEAKEGEVKNAAETYDLVVAKFPSDQKTTGKNVRNAMFRAMADIGFTAEEFAALEWVTDRGANIKKALEDLAREDCAGHLINTVVRNTFTIPFDELRRKAIDASSLAVRNVLHDCEEAVRAVRAAKPTLGFGVNMKQLKEQLKLPTHRCLGYVSHASMLLLHSL